MPLTTKAAAHKAVAAAAAHVYECLCKDICRHALYLKGTRILIYEDPSGLQAKEAYYKSDAAGPSSSECTLKREEGEIGSLQQEGNACFQEERYTQAITHYTAAIFSLSLSLSPSLSLSLSLSLSNTHTYIYAYIDMHI
jgi:hypothetical protein